MSVRVTGFSGELLSVPLLEPFVIATARVDATRAVLVRSTLRDDASGRVADGLGEAAALWPVTREDQPELLAMVQLAAAALRGARFATLAELAVLLDETLPDSKVARAGVESALLDAWARLRGLPVYALLAGSDDSAALTPPPALVTDMTLPIGQPEHMAELALAHRARGFSVFKVKVGKSFDDDVRALLAVHARVADARFRLDANEGFDAATALELVRRARAAGLVLECFEQPCPAHDLDAMARVTREAGVPVIADESVKTQQDLAALLAARAAHGVNLKLVKSGGPCAAHALGRAARAAGLSVMCGGMVETRLGMTAMAHVACALGGVEFVDLDTAFLLAEERFDGGYEVDGATLTLAARPGFGLRLRQEPG